MRAPPGRSGRADLSGDPDHCPVVRRPRPPTPNNGRPQPRTARRRTASAAREPCRSRRRFRVPDVWTTLQAYPIAPGVSFEQFTLTGVRGVTRGQLVRIDPATPGVGLDLVSGRNVASRHVVADMMDPNAVVGVNGDFFDIRDTEAPLGVAKDRQRGILNGVQSDWNSAFWVDAAGVPHIGDVYADAVIRQRKDLDITTVNSPSVRPGEVGLYTGAWGTLRKYRVVDGDRRGVRMVVVRRGRVVSNRSQFPRSHRVRDLVLVGRGSGAGQLARLRRRSADHRRRVAVPGRRDGPDRQHVPRARRRPRGDGRRRPAPAHRDRHRPRHRPAAAARHRRSPGPQPRAHDEGARQAVPAARRRGRAEPRRRRLLDHARPAARRVAGGAELALRRSPPARGQRPGGHLRRGAGQRRQRPGPAPARRWSSARSTRCGVGTLWRGDRPARTSPLDDRTSWASRSRSATTAP